MLDHTHHFKIFSPFLLLDLMQFTTWTRGLFHPMTIQYWGHYSSFVLVQKTTILNMYLGTMIGKIQRSRGVAPTCHSTTFTPVSKVRLREITERWPLLTVETEVNGVSAGSTNERVLPWLVRWACRAGTRDFCPALAALVSPIQDIFTVHYFQFVCPHCPASWAGSRAGSPVS
jgi:hypothetical protein